MTAVDPRLAEAGRIVEAIRARGRIAVVAGGAVRDRALGRPVTDVDIATDMPLDELAGLFRTHEVGRSKQFETVVVARGGHAFEITRLRGGAEAAAADPLREDTARRDFTINALLLDADGRIVDHHGGLDDLRGRVVRAVGSPRERFAEDPARLLRAVRFAAVLEFDIEPQTAAAIVAGAGRLAEVAGERVGAEILKMASAPGAALARGVELMDRLGLLRTVLPEVADLQGLEQPAEWHPEGDAWEHTLAALRSCASADPAVTLAVLLHDVGKRPAHFVENGRHRYHGHEKAGLGLVEAVARRLFLPQRLRAAILFAVAQHGKCGRMIDLRRSRRLALIASEHWPVLRALVLCDIAARGIPAAVARAEEIFGDAERDASEFAERQGGEPLITGTRVMELTGLAPGPRVGQLQRAVSEWALDNRVEERAQVEARVVQELQRFSEGSVTP
jgi:tRNA nucleotidyltransferase/poly(A) polymerase